MSNTTTITVKVSQRVKDRVAEIAREEHRDEAEVGGSLLEASIEEDELTRLAIAEADAGGPFVDGEAMKRYLKSWGKEDELPMPEANIRF